MEMIGLQAEDGLLLQARIYPARQAKGIVQIIHGAKEHQARYAPFAKFLQEHGFAVITSDNRGHGKSVNHAYPLGFMNGVDEMIADQFLMTQAIKERYPNIPLYLFGHSLGSVFARCYLQAYDTEIDKLILSGTVNYVPGVSLGIFLGKIITKISGPHGYNRFLEGLSLKNQKGDAWISVSKDNLRKYRNDPLCQYDYQNQAVITIFEGVQRLQKQSKMSNNPGLPILSISGAGDPITGGEKGLQDSLTRLKKAGYNPIDNIVYPNMNHEVLNEADHKIVYQDVLAFLLGSY